MTDPDRDSCHYPAFRANLLEIAGMLLYAWNTGIKMFQERRESVYRIAVLAEEETEGQYYAEQISRFYSEKGIFPHIVQYQDQECFFENVQKTAPTNVVIAFSGVAGLDMVEHLHALDPACRIIWCSDLDFSLHAYRLRADYFLLKPVAEGAFRQGLANWLEWDNL